MIDISSLTPLQAAIALLIERSGNNGRRLCELCGESNSQKGAIVKVLRRLLDSGIIIKNSGDVARYFAPMDSVGSPSDSTRSPLDSVGSLPDSTRSPSDSVRSPSDSKKSRKSSRKPVVNLTLTESNINNIGAEAPQASDGTEQPDSFALSTQANAGADSVDPTLTGDTMPMPAGSATSGGRELQIDFAHTNTENSLNGRDGKSGSAVGHDSPATAPADPLPPVAPETPQKIDHAVFARQTGQGLPERHVAPPTPPEKVRLLPKATVQKLAENRKKAADEKQRKFDFRMGMLFEIIRLNENVEGCCFPTDTPTDSLYAIIGYLKKGGLVPDPLFIPKYQEGSLIPINSAEMIPMYDAFVRYIQILWTEAKHCIGYDLVNDFILHRAAYLFATELHKKTAVIWETPEQFVKFCYDKSKKVNVTIDGKKITVNGIWSPMVGQTKDVFLHTGLGWDDTILKSSETYTAELDYIAYHNIENPRDELFPNHTHGKFYLIMQTKRAKKKQAETKATRENASKIEVQRTFDLEQAKQAEAAKKKQNAWQGNENFITALEIMSKNKRKETIDNQTPEPMQKFLAAITSEQLDKMATLMTPTQRKYFGVMTHEEKMKKKLGLKPIR